jgi:hypothetical protein
MGAMLNDEWVADLGNMTCRNKANNITVALEKSDYLFIGKIKDIPKELEEQWAAEGDGKKRKEKAVMEAEIAFYWAYNKKAIQKYQRQQKKEIEKLMAKKKGNVRFEKFWKSDLLRTANTILKLYGKKASDKQVYTIEKMIMESVIHFRQNSDYYFNAKRKYPKRISLRSFPAKAVKTGDGGFKITYDLSKGKNITAKLKDLCNDITHVTMQGDYIGGVFFSIKNEAKNAFYFLDLICFSKILLSFREDKEIGVEPDFDKEGNLTEFKFTDKW